MYAVIFFLRYWFFLNTNGLCASNFIVILSSANQS